MSIQAEESLGTKLLKAVVTELQMLSPRFVAMDNDHQGEIIDRLRMQVMDLMHDAVRQVSARSFESVPAHISGVVFKEKVQVTVQITDLKSEMIRALALKVADSVHTGGQCMLVLCDFDQWVGGMDQVKPVSPQRDFGM
jgi:hypothetical protein